MLCFALGMLLHTCYLHGSAMAVFVMAPVLLLLNQVGSERDRARAREREIERERERESHKHSIVR